MRSAAQRGPSRQYIDHTVETAFPLSHAAVREANLTFSTVTDKSGEPEWKVREKEVPPVRLQECSVQCVCFHTLYMLGSASIKHFLQFNLYCTFSKYAGISDFFPFCPGHRECSTTANVFTVKFSNRDIPQCNVILRLWEWRREQERSIVSSQLFPINLNMNSLHPWLWCFK